MKLQTRENRTLRKGVEDRIIRIYLIAGANPLRSVSPDAVFVSTSSASALISVDTGALAGFLKGRGAQGWTERAEGGVRGGGGSRGRCAGRPRGRASRGAGLSNFPGFAVL